MNKKFKVTHIADQPVDDNENFLGTMYAHVLIAVDGECYHVQRPRGTATPDWEVGEIVEVPMRITQFAKSTKENNMSPDWEAVHACKAILYDLADPFDAVSKAFGEEAAQKFLTPKKPLRKKPHFFKVSAFSDSTVMTAANKCVVVNKTVNFMVNFRRTLFTHDVASLFMMTTFFDFGETHSGVLEKLDDEIEEFYQKWFGTAQARVAFCQKVAESTIAGDRQSSLVDMATAVRNHVIEHVLARVTKSMKSAEQLAERQQLRVLLRKYGVPADYKTIFS